MYIFNTLIAYVCRIPLVALPIHWVHSPPASTYASLHSVEACILG